MTTAVTPQAALEAIVDLLADAIAARMTSESRSSAPVGPLAMTVRQAAGYAKLPEHIIRRFMRNGLPTLPLDDGGDLYIARRVLDRWIDNEPDLQGSVPDASSKT